MPSTTSDFSFKMDRTGKSILLKNGEHVRSISTMLFAMRPGMDEYESELGLDLVGRRFQMYAEKTRDTEYESTIVKQFTKYTDLVPLNVIAIYLNESLYVNMQLRYEGDIYTIELSSNGSIEQMSSVLVNINDFNRR